MTEKERNSFYASLGHLLTVTRQQCNISIAQLAQRSGEQYKTIQDIESGKVKCSLHHLKWMKNVLGLDLNKLVTEGKNEQFRIDDLI
jgi:ribosome-binding protein aMBF1 (putative translation factor)